MSRTPLEIDQDGTLSAMMNIKIKFIYADGTQVTGSSIVTCKPAGMIYEGGKNSYWRRIDAQFTVPTDAEGIELTYTRRNNTSYTTVYSTNIDDAAYFDDVRIFPANALMKSFVYDASDFRLKAELNENNFPTYYGYDAAGQLNVVKVLTESGIKTVKEVYSNMQKENP
jgi:hypothetical protein